MSKSVEEAFAEVEAPLEAADAHCSRGDMKEALGAFTQALGLLGTPPLETLDALDSHRASLQMNRGGVCGR